jgi:hypothetical protein
MSSWIRLKTEAALRFVLDNVPPFMALVGGVATSVVGYMTAVPGWTPRAPINSTEWLFVGGQAVTIVGGIWGIFTTPNLRRLRAENTELKKTNQERIRDQLVNLNKKLGFGFDERISVYLHEKQTFNCLARYSNNGVFNRFGRPVYPEGQGCIGAAWMKGSVFIDDLPDSQTPAELLAYARESKNKCGLSTNIAKRMKMKSRTYGGFVLFDPKKAKALGVIIFESRKAQGFTEQDILNIKAHPSIARIEEYPNDMHGVILARGQNL